MKTRTILAIVLALVTPAALVAKPRAARAEARAPSKAASQGVNHVVQRGETLYSISERYGIPLADLRKWNKLRRDQITVGQVLKLKKS